MPWQTHSSPRRARHPRRRPGHRRLPRRRRPHDHRASGRRRHRTLAHPAVL